MAKSVLAQARTWATKRQLFGAQAFVRYVMLRFVENLNRVSDDFVFKGGNLLWVYIGTPRTTVDLDLATRTSHSHQDVRQALEDACAAEEQLRFSVVSFERLDQDGGGGASVSVEYETDQGARNRFAMDIVYALPCESCEITSPIDPARKIQSATIENIVCDKLSACHRFGAGNTRMKDYDDLWRLSRTDQRVDRIRLARLLRSRKVPPALEPLWIGPEMRRVWASHRKRYPDLPEGLEALVEEVNAWLGAGETSS